MSRIYRSALVFSWCVAGMTAGAQQSGQFLRAPMLTVSSSTQRMNALLDFDADGWMDAVGTFCKTSEKAGITLFRNDGTGKLNTSWHGEWTQYANNTTNPFPVVTGDLNNDGRGDFVTALRDEIRVYLSNGAGAPTQVHYILIPSSDEVHDLAIGDFDGNGTLDVAARLHDFLGQTVIERGIRIYNKLLTATPTQSLFLPSGLASGLELHAVDANGDAKRDLMCVGSTKVEFFTLSGTQIVAAGAFTHGLVPLVMGAAGDVDGDTDQDVVLFSMSGNHRVLRRIGPTTFAFDPIAVGGPATDLADVDLDGDLDGVCCGGGGGGPSSFVNNTPSYFEVAKNDGTGSFAPSFKIPALGSNHIAGVADIDHDGDPDLLAGRVTYYNVDGIEPVRFEPVASASYPSDLDGDGDADCTATMSTFDRNNGDGTFTLINRIVAPPPNGSQYLGNGLQVDFDGDGRVDHLITEAVGGVAVRDRLLLNNGGGDFVDGGPITAPGEFVIGGNMTTWALVTFDANADGARDVVVSSQPQSGGPLTTRVYLGTGDGTVTASGIQFSEILIERSDIDADGRDDLIVSTDTAISIRWGHPSGTFASSTLLATSASPSAILHRSHVADLDDDGDRDVLLTVFSSPSSIAVPRICEQLSSRAFAFHDDALPGYHGALIPVVSTDVDLDGHTDLLVGNRQIPGEIYSVVAMSWLRGSAAPGPDFQYMGDQWPLSFANDDLDGDGDIDVMGYNPKIAVFNRALEGPAVGWRKQYGNATAGGYGHKPTFGAKGPFRGGLPAELRMTNVAANSAGILLVGVDDQVAKLGATGGFVVTLPIIVAVNVIFPGSAGITGSGKLTIPYAVPLAAVGYSWFHQIVTIDAGAQGGAAVSNGLEIYYGP
jgi:FG-GAP-like repeat